MKKGSVLDVTFILPLIGVGIISVFVVAVILVSMEAAWPFTGESLTVLQTGISAIYIFDQMIIWFAVGTSIFAIASAYFSRSHPIFFVFSMILLSLVIFFSAQLANALNAFIITGAFATIANNFPLVVTLVRNFPLFAMLIGILVAIAMYAKGEESSGITA